MTPAQAKASHRRQIAAHGETVTLRRVNAAPAPATEVTALARIVGFTPQELVNGISQKNRKVILLADDIGAFPVPFKTNGSDRVVVRGVPWNIVAVDDSTRRVAGELIAYELTVLG